MFGMKRKVQQWQDAGLLTAQQADAIFTHERDSKRGTFGRNLAATAIFAILTGVVSIIASHWYAIPLEAKIGGHLLLNIIVAIVAWKATVRGSEIVRECAALAFFGLGLSILALIGQVFQLEGSISGLLSVWMVMTLPFMAFFGKTRITAVPWMIAFLVTITVVMSEYLDDLPEFWQLCFAFGAGTLLPLALIADGTLPIFKRLKPLYAETFTRTGFLLLAINASVASFYWYSPRIMLVNNAAVSAGLTFIEGYLILAGIFMVAVAAIAIHAMFYKFYRDNPEQRMGVLFAIASVLMMGIPVLIPGGEMHIAAAIIFIVYWIFVGWIGQALAWSRLISLAITLIALRIFSIYIEVFGNMMSTGVGLIAGGAVVLALIWGARKMNRSLTSAVATGGQHG